MARIIHLPKDKLASGPQGNGCSVKGRVEKLERHIPIYCKLASLVARASQLEAELVEIRKERDRLLMMLDKVTRHEATIVAAAGVGMMLCMAGIADVS